ncbi:transmembrane protease serine 9-like [Anopheles ziemanni]|uniref:transmembrane protease serine 9-like n=1 Tax=Anopheles coustani TaxID=139045 RepID=UPI0026584A04|nr:transmembrane protease serine 9-like [Anopheles coustani]XP_058178004.1 transmembrane protease serine 9-like [Anopheles ziemanni]
MKNLHVCLLLSAVLTLTACSANPLEAVNLAGKRVELPIQKTPRIRGGIPVGPEEIPYAVGLMIQQPIGNRFCGATLVSTNYVLTAASCFVNPGSTTVLLGASNMNDVEDIVMANAVILHQAYVPSQNLNDLALVQLSRPANISNYVRLARLPNWRQADSLFTNQLATISGWGALGQNAPEVLPLNNLHRVDGAVTTNTACNLQFLGGIAESHVCVASSSGSPCQGDQGGPLTVQDADGHQTVIGVFSFTTWLGCDANWPAVYTRLTPFLAWIEANSDVTIRNDFEFFPTPPETQQTTTTTPSVSVTTEAELETPTTTVETPTTTVETPTTTVEIPTTTVETPTTTLATPTTTLETPTTTSDQPEATTDQPTTETTVAPEITTLLPPLLPPHRIGHPAVRQNHRY